MSLRSKCCSMLLVLLGAGLFIHWSPGVHAQLTYSPGPQFTQSLDLTQTRIQFTPAQRHKLFRQSDTIGITTTASTTIRVMKLDGTVIYNGAPTTFSGLAAGLYFVETAGDRATFLVLPNDYAGTGFLALEAATYQPSLEKYSQMQPAWVRTFEEGYWATVQPTATTWNWGPLDAIVAANAGRKIVVQTFVRPAWQTNDSQFLSLYVAYVRAIVQRYGTQIYGIEIWNEPYDYGPHYSKLQAPWHVTYDTMVRQAAAAARTVNPAIKIYGLGFVNFTDYAGWFQTFADMGTTAVLDGVTYHDYDTDRFRPDQDTLYNTVTIPRLDTKIARIRQAIGPTPAILVNEIGLNGLSALGIPNLTGYAGVSSSPPISWQRGMARATKYALMYPAAGVTQLLPHVMAAACWGAVPDENMEIYGYEYAERGPHPKTAGVLMAGYWLRNATFVESRVLNNQTFLYAWRRPDNTSVVFAWCIENQTAPFSANYGLVPQDLFGNTLTVTALGELPILFRSASSDAAGLLNTVVTALTNPSPPPSGSGLIGQWLFNEGSGTTAADSAGTNPGVLNNFTSTSGWVAGREGTALLFDGSDDFVLLDSNKLNLTNNFTISGWFSPRNAAGDGVLFCARSGYFSSGLRCFVSGNKLLIQGQATTGWQSNSFAVGGIADNIWYHLAVVYDQSTLKVYLNGVLQGTAVWGGSLVMNATTTSRIGSESGSYFRGVIDSVGVYNRALTSADVLALFQGAGSGGGSAPGPLTRWSLNETSGNTAADSAGSNTGVLQNFTVAGWTTGHSGNGLLLDGADDYVALDSSKLNLTNKFTVTAWVYPKLATGDGVFLSVRSSYFSSGFRFFISNSSLLLQGQTTAGWNSSTFASGTFVNDAWKHVAAVFDGATLTAYVNGVNVGSANWGGKFVMNAAAASRIGSDNGWCFKGIMDEINVYTQALTAAEITTIVNGTPPPANQPPVLAPIGNKSVTAGQALAFTLSASDPDGNPLTYSATGLPSGATFNASTRAFNWTPTTSQAGNYNVTFTVSDGSLTDSETITITVTSAANRAPVLNTIPNQTVNEGQFLTFTISGSDPDGNPLTYSATGLPSGATFTASTRTFSWTPTYTQAGSYNVTFTVSDGSLTASQSVTITVNNVNRPPVLAPIGNQSARTKSTLTFTVSATDPDGDSLSYAAAPLPAGATFNAATRTFSWTIRPPDVGTYNVTFTVADGSLTDSETITITVIR